MSILIPKAITIEREKKAWKMRIRGATYEAIAEELGITFGGVKNILSRLHKRYRDSHMDDVEKCKLEQIGELQNIAHEAYTAWERSKRLKVIKKKRAIGKDGKFIGLLHSTEETYEQEGDTRYLLVYLKAKEDLRKIIGADAPAKYEHTGKNGSSIQVEQTQLSAQKRLENEINKVLPNKENLEG